MIGGIALLVWWAYNRHAFDGVLGLSIPHDETSVMHAANLNVTLKRTPPTKVTPYGPMFNPAGVVTSTAPSGPVFSPRYQDALARVHEPGGARDPFGSISDGLSWLLPDASTSPDEGRIRLNGDPNQNLNAAIYDLGTGEPAQFAAGGSGRSRLN